MTDNICHSILKTATQQIIQSAGFEGANNHSIETLTDVFGKYIELLGSTVSAYANLNGRTTGTAIDLMKALKEIDVEPIKLKTWLEVEGKALTPSWTEQSDPGRLIQGVISSGKPKFADRVEYRFDYGIEEYDILSPEVGSPSSPEDQEQPEDNKNLPEYVPSYFPPFPEIKDDEVMEESEKLSFQKQQQEILQHKKEQEDLQQQKQLLPLPVLVKNRKKPIENPFTHIIPFEDSSFNDDNINNNDQQQQPLSLLVNINSHKKRTEEQEEEVINKRRKIATSSLIDALTNIKSPNYKLGEGIISKDENLFKSQTQNAAAPGNYLFNHDIGVFDQVIRNIADPMVISKLTAPNLQTDIAIFNSSSNMNSTPNTPIYSNSSPFGDHPNSPESSSNGLTRSSSMLAVLANGGSSKKSGLKKMSKSSSSHHIASSPMSLNTLSNQTLSKHSVDINAIKTGDSKYIIKKKRMLLEKQLQLERQQQQEKEAAAGVNNTNGNQPIATSIPLSNTTTDHDKTTSTQSYHASLNKSTVKSDTSTSAATTTTTGPISLSSFASSSLSSSSPSNTSTPSIKMTTSNSSSTEKEKKKHKSRGPKLMLNFSTLPPPNVTDDTSSPNTPKIRFKIKPPEQQQQQQLQPSPSQQQASNGSHGNKVYNPSSSLSSKLPKTPKHTPKPTTTITLQQYQQQKQKSLSDNYTVPVKLEKHQTSSILSSPIPRPVIQQQPSINYSISHNNSGYSSEEIRCICENPTVDYGTFMIACDRCSVWYHGSCVGIAESDQVEEWYCRRCRSQ